MSPVYARLPQRPYSAVVLVFYSIGNLPCFTQQHDHDQMIEFAPVPMGDLIKSFKNV